MSAAQRIQTPAATRRPVSAEALVVLAIVAAGLILGVTALVRHGL